MNESYAEVSGSGEYSNGETVTIKAGERSGYTFGGWTTDSGVQLADSKAAVTTFTMPNKAVTVTASWIKSGGGSGGGGGGSGAAYTDNGDISDYAGDAASWAAEKSIMTGNTDGSFAPKANTTRAQAAAVFMRILENLK